MPGSLSHSFRITFGRGGVGSLPPGLGATLSSLAYAADLISVTTNTASGTIYYLLHNNVTPLSGSAIKSAVIGLTAVGGGTLDPLETDNQPVDWTLVTPGTYWINMVQDTGVFSNVVSLEVTIVSAVFDPANVTGALFVWDPSDISTLFQSTDTSSPVTTSGQFVGHMNNRGSKGGAFVNTGATDRPVYTDSGGLKYFQTDGSNDFLRWLGVNGDIDLSPGFYLCLGMEEAVASGFASFISGATATGDAINNVNGFSVDANLSGTPEIVGFFGLISAAGLELTDTGTGILPKAVVEFEVTPATGSVNGWLRVRRVADGDVVQKSTDTAAAGNFPNNATGLAQINFGSRINGGVPTTFGQFRHFGGVLVRGAISSTDRADCRLWVASRLGF